MKRTGPPGVVGESWPKRRSGVSALVEPGQLDVVAGEELVEAAGRALRPPGPRARSAPGSSASQLAHGRTPSSVLPMLSQTTILVGHGRWPSPRRCGHPSPVDWERGRSPTCGRLRTGLWTAVGSALSPDGSEVRRAQRRVRDLRSQLVPQPAHVLGVDLALSNGETSLRLCSTTTQPAKRCRLQFAEEARRSRCRGCPGPARTNSAARPVLEVDVAGALPVLAQVGDRVLADQGDVRGVEAEGQRSGLLQQAVDLGLGLDRAGDVRVIGDGDADAPRRSRASSSQNRGRGRRIPPSVGGRQRRRLPPTSPYASAPESGGVVDLAASGSSIWVGSVGTSTTPKSVATSSPSSSGSNRLRLAPASRANARRARPPPHPASRISAKTAARSGVSPQLIVLYAKRKEAIGPPCLIHPFMPAHRDAFDEPALADDPEDEDRQDRKVDGGHRDRAIRRNCCPARRSPSAPPSSRASGPRSGARGTCSRRSGR